MSIEAAYLAGYCDGDGTAGVYSPKGHPSPIVCVRGIDAIIPQAYLRHLGTGRLGQSLTSGGRPYYRWAACGLSACEALGEFGPYLRVKRQAALSIMSFGQITPEGPELDAYLAGLFDSDGCASLISPHTGPLWRPYPVTVVTMTDLAGPEAFFHRFGGTMTNRKRGSWKRTYSWRAVCSRSIVVMKALQPYLLVKRERVASLLQWTPLHQKDRRRKVA